MSEKPWWERALGEEPMVALTVYLALVLIGVSLLVPSLRRLL